MAKTTKYTILVVDDNPDLIFSIEEGFKAVGKNLKVISANSGKSCLEVLRTQKPDAILLDIMMPGMDGWDVLAKVKANRSTEKIPVIFLTAKTDPISVGMGKLSAAEYIEKPFDLKDLKRKIEAVIKKNKAK
tara:strand:+ start:82049 stop:82444 length:396 start_codon:yes stop_codon:yes gene_type:complete